MRDSGMSDSQFMKFQKAVTEKIKKFTADTENEVRFRSLKKRLELKSKISSKEQPANVWQRFYRWLCGR